MVTINGIEYEQGIYANGNTYGGEYLAERTISEAESVGFYSPTYTMLADDERSEFIYGIADEAMDHLNEKTSGGYWIYIDGDLMLVADGSQLDKDISA